MDSTLLCYPYSVSIAYLYCYVRQYFLVQGNTDCLFCGDRSSLLLFNLLSFSAKDKAYNAAVKTTKENLTCTNFSWNILGTSSNLSPNELHVIHELLWEHLIEFLLHFYVVSCSVTLYWVELHITNH